MVHEVFFSRKTLLANVATMGRFSRVFTYVVHHVLFTGERFCAELASIGGWNLLREAQMT